MMVLVILVETTTPLKDKYSNMSSLLDDLSSNTNITSEGALFVDVMTFDGFLGSSETQTNILVISNTLSGLLGEELLVG